MRILVSIMLAWQVLLTELYFHQRYEFTQFAEYVGATADPAHACRACGVPLAARGDAAAVGRGAGEAGAVAVGDSGPRRTTQKSLGTLHDPEHA